MPTTKLRVCARVLVNVKGAFPKLEALGFAELLARMRTAGATWDLTIMSHGRGQRAVEIVIYRDTNNRHMIALPSVTAWLESQGLKFEVEREK